MKYILDKIEKDEKQAAKKRKKEEVVEQKRSKQNATKLTALLYKHKEQLKAEILKKRALLDKELQLQVQVGQRLICSIDIASFISTRWQHATELWIMINCLKSLID